MNYYIKPNRKTRVGHLEISCYGKGLIMVKHPELSAPMPIGPEEEEMFWGKPKGERIKSVAESVSKSIPEDQIHRTLGLFEDLDKIQRQ